ncbi:MAG: tRNA (adenosine(37)-N6)-threonylcarbamoyltransferase complex ATPase subunit type 1 TsaE [Candidatus Melainabacteria bacterium GWF2_37_15]|nr:MAG: tRNA (adenosine(37)-N6)-threonylcarbamoyltransferase complex ATPase subunit type 1 TsaE [Candidatus Melainabacteria bacterium GWF2_37_15]
MENTYTFISNSPEDTDKLAEKLAINLSPSGNLICLYGDIGSGKTTFVKSLAKHLGITEKVTSPSFVILNEYHSNNVSLYHFDLYRLEKEGVETIMDELKEYTEKENSVTVIEWAEFSPESLPENRIDIEIKYLGETSREFVIKKRGQSPLSTLH